MTRYGQHRRNPPPRMREDVDNVNFTPFERHFQVAVLATTTSKSKCWELEALYIAQLNATGPCGYNRLSGNPSSTRQYWFLRRRSLV